jgi:hypothetical protein
MERGVRNNKVIKAKNCHKIWRQVKKVIHFCQKNVILSLLQPLDQFNKFAAFYKCYNSFFFLQKWSYGSFKIILEHQTWYLNQIFTCFGLKFSSLFCYNFKMFNCYLIQMQLHTKTVFHLLITHHLQIKTWNFFVVKALVTNKYFRTMMQ